MSDGYAISAGQLRAFIERIERIEEDIKSLNADKSEIYKEARGSGFDVKAVRQCVAARKLDSAEREERNAIFDLYWAALTGSPRVHVHEAEQFDPETGELKSVQPPVSAVVSEYAGTSSDENPAPHHELGGKQHPVNPAPAASAANEIAASILPDPHTPQADGGQPDTSSTVAGAKNDGSQMAIVGQGGVAPERHHGQVEHQSASAAQDRNEPESASGTSATYSEDYGSRAILVASHFRDRAGRRGMDTLAFREKAKTDRPAIIVRSLLGRGSGAVRVAAELTAPTTGRRGSPAGLLNFCGALRHWSVFHPLLQLRQKSRSGFAPSFHASCVAPAFHEQKQTTGVTHELGSIVQERGFFSQGGTHV